MRGKLTPYTIWCFGLFFGTILVTLGVWKLVPIQGDPWMGVVWFALFASLAELLAVNVTEIAGLSVSPSCAILWSATGVLGPIPAVVVAVACGLISMAGKSAAYHITEAIDRISPLGEGRERPEFIALIYNDVSKIGALWQTRSPIVTFKYMLGIVANLALVVGPAGLVYQLLGGRFLVNAGPDFIALRHFVLPFVGLVSVSIAIDLWVYVTLALALNSSPGAKGGFYNLLLRMRIAMLETGLPLMRPQLFLLVVGLLLSYLYASIGGWGFVVATLPVLTLRDFFSQFVLEREAYVNTVTTLATYMQHYHPYTRGHLKRVADLSERLARELRLPAESIRHISTAGFLHDIGKIGVSEEILDKTQKLTDEEWGAIKEHPLKGADIIKHIEFLEGISDWIKYHHKWHNGAGYPAIDDETVKIPMEAAIIATVDAFDAMTDDRELALDWECDSCGYKPDDDSRPVQCPKCGAEKRRTYREPKTLEAAIEELKRGSGTQFHPKVVQAFLTMIERDGLHYNAG